MGESENGRVETKKSKSWLDFLSGKEWIIAAALGLLVYLAFAFPIYTTKLVSDPDNRISIHLWEMMGGTYGFNWLVLVIWIMPLIGIVLACLTKFHKNFLTASMMVFLVSGVLIFICKDLFVYNLEGSVLLEGKTDFALGGIWAPCLCFGAGVAALIGSSEKDTYSVYDLVESGMLVAMAVVLNFIKLPIQVEGSVNFQMLPLFILALRQGPLKGFIGGGIVFGLITCLTDGYGFAFFPFDYMIGFGSCAVLGFFKPLIFGEGQKNYNIKGEIFILVGGILACLVRFAGGCLSSMIYYGYDIVAASAYNAAYIFISGAIAIGVLMAIYGPLLALNRHFSHNKVVTE